MENREILTIDETTAISEAQKAADQIAIRAEKDILKAESDILTMVNEELL